MKSGMFLACATAILALTAQGAQAAPPKHAPAAAAKADDWSLVVAPTAAGGFVMGNPDAKVKLIEFGSMTCPHCAEFDETATPLLIRDYVKTGKVSFEFRNYVRDAIDVTASLIARCNGAKSFFPLTRALFADQAEWDNRVREAPQEELARLDALPTDKKFLAAAKLAGLQKWAAARGVPESKTAICLENSKSVDKLVQMGADAKTDFPEFDGTPAFVINRKMVEFGEITAAEVWPTLEAQIRSALGEQSASTTQPSPINGAKN